MKKLSIFAVAFAAIAFAACGGNKSAQNVESADSTKSFEQEQIEASIKMHVDSLASEIGKLKQLPILQADGTIKLTADELKVKPDYLLTPSVAENATTLAEKYRLLAALQVDKSTAKLYEMPVEDYEKAITKLAADIDDPSFKAFEEGAPVAEATEALYNAMNENGRINYFWQSAAASLVEQLYLINQNADKFLVAFDDDAAANSTFRVILILDALNRLAQYDPDIKPVADALAPLDVLNATTVDELKKQLVEAKDKIEAARQALVK
ncbi:MULTISPECIES: hypothetical protein [unclassified Prevotella]|uniref:hypothetical protein n=1 Tax=unclassified Prevotella TaxID=2638335 RepID=UPI000490A664|nr:MULTISPECIES: hypothetical protein [unclassified Prevotella]